MLEPEELEDGEVDRGVQTETSLIWADSRVELFLVLCVWVRRDCGGGSDSTLGERRVSISKDGKITGEKQNARKSVEEGTHLDSITAVDLDLSLVVLPSDTELDNSFRDLGDGECLFVLGVLLEERLESRGDLSNGLQKLNKKVKNLAALWV